MSLLCEICGSRFLVGRHHKFRQDKVNRKLYPDFIDDARNIQFACVDCHASHRSPDLIMWNEFNFCEAMGIEPRSKLWRAKR